MPVGGVLAEADVAHDKQARKGRFERLDALDYGAGGGAGLRARRVLGGGVQRDAEEDDGFQAPLDEGGQEGDEFVDAAAARGLAGGWMGWVGWGRRRTGIGPGDWGRGILRRDCR